MKHSRILSLLLVVCMILSMFPTIAAAKEPTPESVQSVNIPEPVRGIHNNIVIDDNATGGYEGDYVVIYNPATSSSTSYSTGTLTGLIETTVNPSITPAPQAADSNRPFKIDIDAQLEAHAQTLDPVEEPEPMSTRP